MKRWQRKTLIFVIREHLSFSKKSPCAVFQEAVSLKRCFQDRLVSGVHCHVM